MLGLAGGLCVSGCLHGEKVPESAYDPDIIETAKAIQKEQEAEREAFEHAEEAERKKQTAECSRTTGGCKEGYLCWDSWYCKHGFSDQCTASGDKKCHKRCANRKNCPKEYPICREVPIYNGSDRGVLEKICTGSLR